MLGREVDVEEALNNTEKVMKSEKTLVDKHGKYAPIYMAPTGNVIDAIKVHNDINVKRALTVGSQGAFAYEIAINTDAEVIDCFDINILQYMFFELFNAALMYLEHPEFIKFFLPVKHPIGRIQVFNDMFDEDYFFDIIAFMDGPAQVYWSKMFMMVKDLRDLFKTNLFLTAYPLNYEYLSSFASLYKPYEYEVLKSKLLSGKVKINYHICDLGDIHKEFAGNVYELIVFGNILQYYKSIPKFDNIVMVNKAVKENWAPMLSEGGALELCYGFETVTSGLIQMLGIDDPALNPLDMPLPLAKMINDDVIKDNFITQFYKRYADNYSIDFIGQVEREHPKSKNVILSYKKR